VLQKDIPKLEDYMRKTISASIKRNIGAFSRQPKQAEIKNG
jgi:hypothetical protein